MVDGGNFTLGFDDKTVSGKSPRNSQSNLGKRSGKFDDVAAIKQQKLGFHDQSAD